MSLIASGNSSSVSRCRSQDWRLRTSRLLPFPTASSLVCTASFTFLEALCHKSHHIAHVRLEEMTIASQCRPRANIDCQLLGFAVANNSSTWRFQQLLHHVMELLARADRKRERAQQAANAVCFLRLIMKHLTENMNAAHLTAFVNGPPHTANGSSGKRCNIATLIRRI